MALRSDWSEDLCPIARALDVVGDPWVMLIVRNVLHGHGRFDTLRRNLGISEAVLSRRLNAMVDAGLLDRADYTKNGRTRQGYVATQATADLLPVIQQLAVWSEKHVPIPDGGAHMPMIHTPCGEETTGGQVCSSCGQALVSEDMVWVKPWRGTRDQLMPTGALLDD